MCFIVEASLSSLSDVEENKNLVAADASHTGLKFLTDGRSSSSSFGRFLRRVKNTLAQNLSSLQKVSEEVRRWRRLRSELQPNVLEAEKPPILFPPAAPERR